MSRVRPAQRVRIGIETEGGQILQFFSYIKKVADDRLTLVFSPTKAHFAQYLVEGSMVRLSIYTPVGILLSDSMVINEPVDCEFEVEFTQSKKRIQRRKYVRVKANYRLIIEQNGRTYTALSEDIGGGGIRFICDASLELSNINGKIFIPEMAEGLSFSGNVVIKQGFKHNEYLLVFDKITEENRNKIIQKCIQLESINARES